ncbi:protein singed wings 2-like isoform X1 [Daphnia pulicaria]|uniref:protein singed wings 2-like isoform X1 n=2 Tax=Daphnia pulicaria TaxID=35523 RepID=UPI001EEBD34D|nr:protein singed wings 2-like isoform X1 [Daphnia pulicaria]
MCSTISKRISFDDAFPSRRCRCVGDAMMATRPETIRAVVWLLVLILAVGTSQRQMHPDASTVTLRNNSSLISNSWNRAARHFQPEHHHRNRRNDQQSSCLSCGNKCNFQDGQNLTCYNVSRFTPECLANCSAFVVNLTIVQGGFNTMNDSGLLGGNFTQLRILTIRHSNLTRVEWLPNPERLIQLNLSNNTKLRDVAWHIFNRTTQLEILILANNTLSRMAKLSDDSSLANLPGLSKLDLSGNEWDCVWDFQFVLKLHERGALVNGDHLMCKDTKSQQGSWIEWNYSIVKRETNKKTVNAECLSRTKCCDCKFTSEGKEGRVSYTVQVDCSYKQLTSLPAQLPSFTNELDVTGNNLTSLDQVIRYRNQSLKILIADDNQIVSIRNLSNSDFIRNFSRFSLKNNYISPYEIPLEDIVQVPTEFQIKYIYLYNNSWECDCNMATKVRDWLWKYRNIVNDSSILLCSRDGKKIPVLHLLPNLVCEGSRLNDTAALAEQEEHEIFLLHAIIYVEVAAICVLALKLAYDFWHYFRYVTLDRHQVALNRQQQQPKLIQNKMENFGIKKNKQKTMLT